MWVTRLNSTALKLLDGSYTTQQFQVGANANQTIGVSVTSARAIDMGNNLVNSQATSPSMATAAVGASLGGAVNGFLAQTLTLAGNGTVNTIPATGTLAAGSSAKTVATAIKRIHCVEWSHRHCHHQGNDLQRHHRPLFSSS